MRLIDADALIAQMEADAEQMEDPIAKMFAYSAIVDTKLAPTVDAVPVIRCEDCMFYQKDRGKFMAQKFRSGDGICKMHNYAKVTAAKDFCSWAKREE